LADARWSFGDAIFVRAAGLTSLLLLVAGLVAPQALFSPWGLAIVEPATFYRWAIVCEGVLGFALLRALRLPRAEGRLTLETAGLAKLAFFAVVFADAFTHRIPGRATAIAAIDLVFGVGLYRIARRSA
jgi:hypothetical protein